MTTERLVIPFPELFQEVVEGVFCLPVFTEMYDYDMHYTMVQHRLYRIDAETAYKYRELIETTMAITECTYSDAISVLRNHSFWKPMVRVQREEIDYRRDR
jgi:hypothetical protein